MFTRTDLDDLMADESPVTVSFTLPTHVSGPETREGPIRLKNLVARARVALVAQGSSPDDADALLQPALDLIEDTQFWQYQDAGLAVFLGGHEPHVYRVPLPLDEHVAVGRRFAVRSMLPLLAVDGHFHVATLTENEARVFQASRYAMTEVTRPNLPDGVGPASDSSDDGDPNQPNPIGRAEIGTVNLTSAQVRGRSPAEWRKKNLVEYARQVAADLDDLNAADPTLVVLIASSELAGHVQKFSSLGASLAAVVDTNPAAHTAEQLHQLAYEAIAERLDQARVDAVDTFLALQGQGSPTAVDDPIEIMHLAQEGRVQTLLLEDPDPFPADAEALSHLLEAAVTGTLGHGGEVYLVDASDLPRTATAAILRY